jgi:hypothetical protein
MQVASPTVERPVTLLVAALEPAMTASVANDSHAGEVDALDLHHADLLQPEHLDTQFHSVFPTLDRRSVGA